MKLAILGTRGIPNFYGGFEQFAEYLSVGLTQMGHEVVVYNSHNHPYQKNEWKNVSIIRCYDPEHKLGTIGQFIYDFNCIIDSRKRDFDVILQLGYTSSSIWNWLFRKDVRIVTNMDGLEWKRTKYSEPTKLFLKFAECLAVKFSDDLVSDSIGIQKYLHHKYNINSEYIPYGATVFETPDEKVLEQYDLKPFEYDILIARLEPENNIESIINGFIKSDVNRKLVVVGSLKTKLARKIHQQTSDNRVQFLDFIPSLETLNNLRYFSNLYFHGHTVGGTNPSLLEAMSSNALICAHNNIFNKSILESHAFYFDTENDITDLVNTVNKTSFLSYCTFNQEKILSTYSHSTINKTYERFLNKF
ncbi:MAG: DUF1972 domain-containing protein [Flavobacteriales bacterium]